MAEGRDLRDANLRDADLRDANLRNAILTGANLRNADLSGATLSDAELHGADLTGAILRNANLGYANLRDADLNYVDLRRANLTGAILTGADLTGADLRDANLDYATLSDANLSGANLSDANLSGANLGYADLSGANLSGVTGLLQPQEWLYDNLEVTELGITVYKTFSEVFDNVWGEISEGMYITEICNPLPTLLCGSGVNVATASWVLKNTRLNIWECLIVPADYPSIVVPYATDGKFRTGGVWVLHRIDREELFRKDRENAYRRLS